MNAREYLESFRPTREEVDRFLSPTGADGVQPNHGRTYDAELGWVHVETVVEGDGVDGSRTFYQYEPDGARRVIHERGEACRVHTYGDSFTHCDQVSDGETWQEYLAAHLREPIRNYGVGGHSVYQAYRRMLKVEREGPHRARYIILTIYDDDHFRNLDPWRGIRTGQHTPSSFTLPHLRVNVATGECREIENPISRREDVYKLCDPEWVWAMFKDDPILALARVMNASGEEPGDFEAVARQFGLMPQGPAEPDPAAAARRLHLQASLLATQRVLEWTVRFIQETGKELMVILAFGHANMAAALRGEPPFDQVLLDFLSTRSYPVLDMRDAFLQDYRQTSLDPETYLKRFYIGHLTPWGNLFTAWAIKDRVVAWLDPRPAPYARESLMRRGAADHSIAARLAATTPVAGRGDGMAVEAYLESLVPSRKEVEAFIEPPAAAPWLSRNYGVTFDPELGWVQSRAILLDGVGQCGAFYDYEPDGARRVVHGTGRPGRIGTFGDSFTHGDQVSDGETWQEYLAAHLQEPIHNYGVGGYSVYQAYLRMRKVHQARPLPVPPLSLAAARAKARWEPSHVVLNIYEHDHARNLTAFWGISFGSRVRCGFTCPGLRVDVAADRCTPFENLFSSPQDVYKLCDRDYVVETFRDDPTLPVYMVKKNYLAATPALVERVAASFGLPLDAVSGLEPREAIDRLFNAASLCATQHVLTMVEAFADQVGAKLLVILSHSLSGAAAALHGKPRSDQVLLDFIRTRPYPVIDIRDAFHAQFRHSRLTPEAFLAPYYCGHHSPVGNAFTAWAIKDAVVAWLDPRPAPYARRAEEA